MESKSIFREKSIERVSSPEQLNDYIKVTTPSIWVILLAVAVLLIGLLVWSIFGEIRVNTAQGVEIMSPISYLIG